MDISWNSHIFYIYISLSWIYIYISWLLWISLGYHGYIYKSHFSQWYPISHPQHSTAPRNQLPDFPRFHTSYGAKVLGLVPTYRPEAQFWDFFLNLLVELFGCRCSKIFFYSIPSIFLIPSIIFITSWHINIDGIKNIDGIIYRYHLVICYIAMERSAIFIAR